MSVIVFVNSSDSADWKHSMSMKNQQVLSTPVTVSSCKNIIIIITIGFNVPI